MKIIYLVIGDNGESYEDHYWWNEKAFTSKDSAQKYIETRTQEIRIACRRYFELDEISDHRDLTEEENQEYDRLRKEVYFYDDPESGSFYVEELELYD